MKFDSNMVSSGNVLKDAILNPARFAVIWEQVPGRGALETQQQKVIENAAAAAKTGKIHGISVTDNPGGNPAISNDVLCSEIRKLGVEPLVHVAMRDRSRNQVESLFYQLEALGLKNLLVLTGDYPSDEGFMGMSNPVFDLDAVTAMQLVKTLNNGLQYEAMGKKNTLKPTNFFAGVAISPFKQTEAELLGQYSKLQKKLKAGADFVITQVGYDARKFHELLVWLKTNNIAVPALASIYVISRPVAKNINANKVAGAVVTEKLYKEIELESAAADKGKAARLDRAAKMYAIVKGMGYSGASIGGLNLSVGDVEYIVEKGESLAAGWTGLVKEFDYPQSGGFYYFLKDEHTGLNQEIPAVRNEKPASPLTFRFSALMHSLLFKPGKGLFKPARKKMEFLDNSPLKPSFHFFENMVKVVLFKCKDCGDCALFDIGYLCPISQCPKNQRNGPCGGSYEGWCEVYPGEKKCVWVKAYQRLKSQHKENTLSENIVPPCDWKLRQTSSWLNYFLGRDHISRRLGIQPPKKETAPAKNP